MVEIISIDERMNSKSRGLVGIVKQMIPQPVKEPLKKFRKKIIEASLPFYQPVVKKESGTLIKFNIRTPVDYLRIIKDNYEHIYKDRLFGVIKRSEDKPVFWDIGAAQGVFSIPVSLIRPDAIVLAVDPDPVSEKSFKANAVLNSLILGSRVKYDNRAVTDTDGENVTFHYTNKANCAPSLKPTKEKLDNTTTVNTVTLDGLIAEGNLSPTVIKIDVEGAEGLVLRGGEKLFKENPPRDIFIELHPQFLREHFNSSPEEVINLLLGWGYIEVFRIDRSGTTLCHFSKK